MRLQIPHDKIVKAAYVETWNMSLFGNPKATIQCGKCSREYKTRQYHPFYENYEYADTISCCQYCGYWNKLGLKMI